MCCVFRVTGYELRPTTQHVGQVSPDRRRRGLYTDKAQIETLHLRKARTTGRI